MILLIRFFAFLYFCLLFTLALHAGDRNYQRAQSLIDDDPLEADALLADTIRTTGNAKIRRAARYDLFYLRLRLGRFSEAYPLATGKGMRSRFIKTAAAHFRSTEAKLSRVIAATDEECDPQGDAGRVGQVLAQNKGNAALYDFALQRLESCKTKEMLPIFPVLAKENQQISETRLLNIYTLKVRSLISAGEYETAEQGIALIREAAADLLSQNAALEWPLLLAEARSAALQANTDAVGGLCKKLGSEEAAAAARKACLYLKGFALLKSQKYAEAAKVLNALKAEPREIDNRLLKLTAAVAARQVPVGKLHKYTRRASYRYQAKVLRDLAGEITAAADEN